LRSYPRRYRAVIVPIADDDNVDELAQRPGPDGRSALDHVEHAAGDVARLGDALHQVLVHDNATLDPTVLDDDARGAAHRAAGSVEPALDQLQLECERLAATIDGVGGDAWARQASVGGGRSVMALDVAREAVRAGAEHLRAAERAMEAARRG
jgi:hypothetical protein